MHVSKYGYKYGATTDLLGPPYIKLAAPGSTTSSTIYVYVSFHSLLLACLLFLGPLLYFSLCSCMHASIDLKVKPRKQLINNLDRSIRGAIEHLQEEIEMDEQQQAPCVPPGFRFHPTEEELVGYYLARKVASQKIDLDIIREVDLYRIEPWDLQGMDVCVF